MITMNADISSKTYFEIFSLPESFQPDSQALNQTYRKLQAQYHPDRFVEADDRKRRLALQFTSILNDAFETLKSPLKRAAYLLSLHGVDPEENNQAHLGPDFLFKQIQLREALETIEETESLDELETLKEQTEVETADYLESFRQLYEAGRFSEAKPVYSKLQFLYKLSSEINQIEEKLLDY